MYKQVKFKPWVGANYQARQLFGKRVLIVGESHYNEDGIYDDNLTSKCVDQFELRGETSNRTYRMIPPALLGKFSTNDLSRDERVKFWNGVAFYNYIQEIVHDGPGGKRTNKQWSDAVAPFYEVIETLKPEWIIVFSVAVGDKLPRTNAVEKDVEGLRCVEYTLASGGKSLLAVLTHPTGGLAYQDAHDTIAKLKRNS